MKSTYSLVYRKIKLCLVACIWQIVVSAQAAGSGEIVNGYMAVSTGCTHASAGENLYIGPGTYLINGSWLVYSKNVWISPNAVFSGIGTIRFFNPSAAGGIASSTLIDGNNSSNFVNVNVRLDNASDMVLTDMAATTAMTSAGWADNTGNASLSVGSDFDFAVDNGDAVLGSHDMTLGNTATLSNYKELRHVVTAGAGHLVKQNYTGGFIFPVGMAPGDYTPAQITNTIANTMHVNVTNYDAVISATFPGSIFKDRDGVNRGWNIYADNAAGNSLINLEHNDSTEGYIYDDLMAFVTRFTGARPNSAGDNTSYSYWESNNYAAGTGTGTLTTGPIIATASERSRTYTSFATSASASTAWYTKASDLLNPLPVSLISFTGQVAACGVVKLAWQTAQEQDLLEYEIEQSRDAVNFKTVASVAPHNLFVINNYSFTASQSGDINYYRLKIKETDLRYRYSNIIMLKMNCGTSTTRVYPVPFSNTLTIVTGENEVKKLFLFDATGKLVKVAYTRNGNIISLNGAGIPNGTYIIHLKKKNGTTEDIKVMKK